MYSASDFIRYGDFQPSSNSGRPFFVFWTLLAVPTLTILISNMGDTVVKAVSDATIWLGSLTILPGEGGLREGVKLTFKQAREKYFKKGDFSVNQPPGFLRKGALNGNTDESQDEKHRADLEDRTLARVTKHLEEEELEEAHEAENEHDLLMRDVHFYHYVLARELRNLMRDVNASPPKQYSYEEWSYYLRLVGQDESNPDLHRAPKIKPNRDRDIGEAGAPLRDPDEPPSSDDDDKATAHHMKWSWLGTRSPLMADESEAEWILARLSAALESELKKVHSGKAHEPPPIRMAELRERMKAKGAHATDDRHKHTHQAEKHQQQDQQQDQQR
jgi:potassium channel subfamily K, other eukaryote